LAPVALLAVVLVWLWRMEPTRWGERVALALVVGGGTGNLVDRVRLGYVIDFIDWHWYERFTWPTFNIADAALVTGTGLLLVVSIWRDRRTRLAASG
jgi:signal peptidase II